MALKARGENQRLTTELESLQQLENPAAHAYAGPQFSRLERLGDVIVCPSLHGSDEVFASRLRSENQDIGIRKALTGADAPAHLDAVHTRHHPIEDRQPRAVFVLQSAPCFL